MASQQDQNWTNPKTDDIQDLLKQAKTVAVVGMSGNAERASHQVGKYLKENGYEIIPINPGESEILGLKAFPDLKSVARPIDVVDIFRKAEATPPIIEEAIAIGAGAVWLQEGIVSEESYKLATEAEVPIIMDRCMKKEHLRMTS